MRAPLALRRYQAISASRLCSMLLTVSSLGAPGEVAGHSRNLLDSLATHVQHTVSIPRSPRPHCALVFNRGSVGASSSCSFAPACLPGLAPCLPPAALCIYRHAIILWYGRQDHDRHTAATRCANPTRDHPWLCARHDRCRQPSATIPISQDTRLR